MSWHSALSLWLLATPSMGLSMPFTNPFASVRSADLVPRASPVLLNGTCGGNNLKLWPSSPEGVGDTEGKAVHGISTCFTSGPDALAPVKSIEVWPASTNDKIAAIYFTWADGTNNGTGTKDPKSVPQTLTLQPGEYITNTSLYDDGVGHYLGHIYMETSKGQTFDVGCNIKGKKLYQIDSGSGILVGMQASSGTDNTGENAIVYYVPLYFESRVANVTISNITYAGDPTGTNRGIQVNSDFGGQWQNNLTTPQKYNLKHTYQESQSHQFVQSTASSFVNTTTTSFTASLPGIVSGTNSAQFTWGMQQTNAVEYDAGSSAGVSCQASGSIPPNGAVKVAGTFGTGTVSLIYTSQVQINFVNGQSVTYPEQGQLQDITSSLCNITTTDISGQSDPLENTNNLLPDNDSSDDPSQNDLTSENTPLQVQGGSGSGSGGGSGSGSGVGSGGLGGGLGGSGGGSGSGSGTGSGTGSGNGSGGGEDGDGDDDNSNQGFTSGNQGFTSGNQGSNSGSQGSTSGSQGSTSGNQDNTSDNQNDDSNNQNTSEQSDQGSQEQDDGGN